MERAEEEEEAKEEEEESRRKVEDGREEDGKLRRVKAEVKRQLWLSAPLIVVSLLQFCLQLISVMFVGHLGSLPLSAASIATSFASITGFSLLMGTASALDTLCGQSYGAKVYNMLGIHMQRAMVVLLILCCPLSIIWANTEHFLLFLHQDKSIAKSAGSYSLFMIPSLFAYSLLQCLNRFLQSQNNVFPLVLCSGITALQHFVICWALVFKSGLGHKGAALANSVSYWLNVILLSCYVKFSSSCSETWTGFSVEALHNVLAFIKLAVPSALMVCLEMWSFELLVLLSGLLPNPVLETSVLSICLNTAAAIWMISFALSGAASTRVSNELGAGKPEAAKLAARVVISMAIVEGIMVGSVLLLIRNVWGEAYSNEAETIRYIARMMPILALSNFLDSLQSVLSGIARGCGWQKVGAFVNLGSYYLVGVPSALFFGFLLHFHGRGLWLGIICSLIVQVLGLSFITIRTDWDEEAKNAANRVGRTNTEDLEVGEPTGL
ncbi:PREDICTED: protein DETOXIFICATION 16-like isoform X2 [Tarenaya hassleriana]|uniref:protein DETOXIFICATION 16-like isoform X2 n=1 Tax=Tarenaya hassleriana TaxID=28532 RepID=UPI00053C17E3|nr:PREDICTED: protein DETOXIFICATION 16-like isoform X2 [Tarenaya hassleriana]